MGQKGCRFSLFLFSPVQVGPTVVIQQRLVDSLVQIKLKSKNVAGLSNAVACFTLKCSRDFSKLGR